MLMVDIRGGKNRISTGRGSLEREQAEKSLAEYLAEKNGPVCEMTRRQLYSMIESPPPGESACP
jgi:hypothetical protein